MSLTIEDGSGVVSANSFATVAEARAYAGARALSLPATDADVEALLVKACDFLGAQESRYQGQRSAVAQALAWPRSAVYLFGSLEPLPSNQIPSILKQAQCQLAVDVVSGDLQPLGEGREVLQETVGPLTTVYAARGSTSVTPQPNKALAMLEPLFKSVNSLRTFRA